MFLSSFVVGCAMFKPEPEKWAIPQRPNLVSIQFVPMQDLKIKTNGFYLSEINASNLVTNIQEMKYYSLKLEALLNDLKTIYNLKLEVYKSSER
jgi:hypothetical protein